MSFCYQIVRLAIAIAVLTACEPRPEKLTIACAASVQFAMDEVVTSFESTYDVPCQIVVGSSGKLSAQIINGAPFDVFVSADMEYPHTLFDMGLATEPPSVYGEGQLVLWTKDAHRQVSLDLLETSSIRSIAIANPRLAPYGRAAMQVLQDRGNFDRVEQKLVFGESIAQVNQFISIGAVDIGFASLSTVTANNLDTVGSWKPIPNELYDPLPHGAVLISRSPRKVVALQFQQYLLSEEGRSILGQYGYFPPKPAGYAP